MSLAFIVGGLVVAVDVLLYLRYGRDAGRKDIYIKIKVPKFPAPKSGG